MSKPNGAVFRLPTDEYRALPFPHSATRTGHRARIGTCFVPVDQLPDGLDDWMEVNPRIPKKNKKDKLVGPVAKAMIRTLIEDPDKFSLKNQGIYLLANKVDFAKEDGGRGVVTVEFTDGDQHGIVNGGHTYLAIKEAALQRQAEALDQEGDPWPAYVRLHILEGIESDDIIELAEGLNRSMQVDNPSLEDLRGTFDKIKNALGGKQGEQQIAYFQGDQGDLDVQQVLAMMALFNLERYPDRKRHPNDMFGSPKRVLELFTKDAASAAPVFDRLLPKLHDILVLADRIQQDAVAHVGKLKVKDTKQNNRVRSPKYKNRPAHFAGGTIGGLFPLGWLFPMLAAFRANISSTEWAKGNVVWVVDPEQLLNAVIDEMAEVIKQEHQDNLRKPAEVGRKEAAYRLCYGIVAMELAGRGLYKEIA